MIVIVTGGRHYSDVEKLSSVLTWYHTKQPISLVMHGSCFLGGADQLAENWAKVNHVPYLGIPAKDILTNPENGPKRNAAMAALAKVIARNAKLGELEVRCIAFPGGRGTASMIKEAKAEGIKVKEIK